MKELIKIKDLSALSKVNLKAEASKRASNACTHYNSIEVYASLRKLMEFATEGMKSIRTEVLDEYYKYPEKEVKIKDISCLVTTGNTIWDYEQDSEYAELVDKLAERRKLLDAAQTQDIFDSEGIKIPKIMPKGMGADRITIKW